MKKVTPYSTPAIGNQSLLLEQFSRLAVDLANVDAEVDMHSEELGETVQRYKIRHWIFIPLISLIRRKRLRER